MTDLYSASSTVSPITALLWCLYPVTVLVIIEILLGGGFDDDNNDEHDAEKMSATIVHHICKDPPRIHRALSV